MSGDETLDRSAELTGKMFCTGERQFGGRSASWFTNNSANWTQNRRTCDVVVHLEFILKGGTVNRHLYRDILLRLRNSILLKLPQLCRSVFYSIITLHIGLCLSNRNWKDNRSSFATPSILTWSLTCYFFLFPAWKNYVRVDFSGRRDRHFHKRSRAEYSY